MGIESSGWIFPNVLPYRMIFFMVAFLAESFHPAGTCCQFCSLGRLDTCGVVRQDSIPITGFSWSRPVLSMFEACTGGR
jgi:hypothetical protein